jgi:hypothetical protein
MSAIINGLRIVLVGLILTLSAPLALANAATTFRTVTATEPAEKPRAGSPEMGVLIILGAVAFLVFVAWVFSRVGDDRNSGDRSMI